MLQCMLQLCSLKHMQSSDVCCVVLSMAFELQCCLKSSSLWFTCHNPMRTAPCLESRAQAPQGLSPGPKQCKCSPTCLSEYSLSLLLDSLWNKCVLVCQPTYSMFNKLSIVITCGPKSSSYLFDAPLLHDQLLCPTDPANSTSPICTCCILPSLDCFSKPCKPCKACKP